MYNRITGILLLICGIAGAIYAQSPALTHPDAKGKGWKNPECANSPASWQCAAIRYPNNGFKEELTR